MAKRLQLLSEDTGRRLKIKWVRKTHTKRSRPEKPFPVICHMDVSLNGGTPKSSNLIGISIINHPFWGTPIFGNTQYTSKRHFLQYRRETSVSPNVFGQLDFHKNWSYTLGWLQCVPLTAGSWLKKRRAFFAGAKGWFVYHDECSLFCW